MCRNVGRWLALACTIWGICLWASCEHDEFGEDCTPLGRFEVDGTVVQAGTDTPIKGIQVFVFGELATTEDDGSWALAGLYLGECEAILYALDIDGEAGDGLFEATSVPLELEMAVESCTRSGTCRTGGTFQQHDVWVEMVLMEEPG